MFNIKKCLFFILLPLSLIGCGGENEEQLSQENIAINAQDLLTFAPIKNTQIIDLRQKVTAENNQNLIIENVESIDNNCAFNKNDINGLTFKVTTDGANICRFKYNVKPASSQYKGTSEAIVQVVVTDDYTKGDFLPPVSRTITESDSLTLDAKDLLIETGFKIDPDSVYLTGETSSPDIGSLTFVDVSSITYQAPTDTTGTVRIFYTEIDSINNIARPGVAYIAIGQKGNYNPVALDARIDPTDLTKGDITIDISSYISDLDKTDLLQLIDVKTFNGSVKINSEHSFIYTPHRTGVEVLTYIISDHNGGYGIGTLSFEVMPYEAIIDKEQKLLFTPPLTIEQVSATNGIFTNTYQEKGVTGIIGVYPTFDKVLAEAYCLTKGMSIASLTALQKMRENVLLNESIFSTKYLWHSGKPYLTHDSDAISLDTGKVESTIDGYFSCADTLVSRSWSFVSSYYGAQYNVPTTVYISAKTASGGSIFLAKDQYNLNYSVESMNVNGELIDLSRVDDFITVEIVGNEITVKKANTGSEFAVNVTLNISDPIAGSSKTKIILGITVCPRDITDPPEANRLGCIFPVEGRKNEIFTLALSNTLLRTVGIEPDVYNHIGNRDIGAGFNNYRGITWQLPTIPEEDRAEWLNVINQACDAMNKLKLAGRSNWSAGANNLPDKRVTKYFRLGSSDAKVAKSYVNWMHDIDHGKYGEVAWYGQGYVNAYPNKSTVANQNQDWDLFDAQDSSYSIDTISFVSCWSKN